MYDTPIKRIFSVFEQAGEQVFIVGGAVRNRYLNTSIKDIDFAVSCAPERTLAILKSAGIRTVPTGLSHGTITALVGDATFEVTSFRKDVRTDGRHAETEFGGTLLEDAMRRDFTINALYLDASEQLVDPLNAFPDLQNRQLKFVGDANARVTEDYLRMLRFFRFLSQYDLHPDPIAMQACTHNAQHLHRISAERIGAEMRGLMAGQNARHALALANDAQIRDQILPAFDDARFQTWNEYAQAQNLSRDWRVETTAATSHIPRKIWRLSNAETQFIKALQQAVLDPLPPLQMGEKYGTEIAIWALHLRAASTHQSISPAAIDAVQTGAQAEFPIGGHDLIPLGYEGKNLGEALEWLKANWRASDYTLDKSALLRQLQENR